MSQEITICFASDDNYAPYMGLAILSILQSAAREDSFHFYILDLGIGPANKNKIDSIHKKYPFHITYLPVNKDLLKGCDPKHLSLATFGRFFIPELIPCDKVLYLDCDIMARGSLQPLWQTDLTGYYLAGVPDYGAIYRGELKERFGPDFDASTYVNAGVLLINNKKQREENICPQLLNYAIKNASALRYADQDAINFICQKKKLLPERYNMMGMFWKQDLFAHLPVTARMEQERRQTVLRHFHPWKKNLFCPHREEYIALMRTSPWASFIPQDDPKPIAWAKAIGKYIWHHPFCLLTLRFYKRLKMRGPRCLFMD